MTEMSQKKHFHFCVRWYFLMFVPFTLNQRNFSVHIRVDVGKIRKIIKKKKTLDFMDVKGLFFSEDELRARVQYSVSASLPPVLTSVSNAVLLSLFSA